MCGKSGTIWMVRFLRFKRYKMNLTRAHRIWLPALLFVMLWLPAGCAVPPTAPLRITDISVAPEPVIGQTATLRVEVMSKYDEPDAAIIIDLPQGVKLMGGDILWEGSLKANQPQTHEISICVPYEGDWRLWMAAQSQIAENSFYGDTKTLHLIVTGDTVRVVPGGAYRITQPPGGMVHPTDVPKTPPANICQ